MQIGPHRFSGRFFLAPLAGVSDRPFRLICRELGAAFAYTEMVSAHGLLQGNPNTEGYLDRDPAEVPFAVQIFAAEPDVLARGAAAAVARGADIVDINMACPVKKVCGSGAGAALARDPASVEAAVRAVRAAAGVPVTIKIRSGWDASSVNCVDVARAAEAGGASAVALHGRTRSQGYAGQADWGTIRAVKEAVAIPVLGSGDVWSSADALRMARETGCDFVLVARGACGNPWIFRELRAAEQGLAPPPAPDRDEWGTIRAVKEAVAIPVLGSGDVWSSADALRMARETGCDFVLVARGACGNPWIFRELRAAEQGLAPPPAPDRDEWAALVLRHLGLQISLARRLRPAEDPQGVERAAVRELRSHLLWYTRGRRGGVHFRRDAAALLTADDVARALDRHFPRGGAGFEADPAAAPPGPAEA